MKKILSIFGTRPEAIKMAPVIKEIQNSSMLQSVVCVTAQHREMLDQVLEVFNITPDYDLDIMKSNQSLVDILVNIIRNLEIVIKKEKPDLILVHGDTSTTFAASLLGFYNKIKIGHVEAGLRTYNKFSPFPEEVNRQLTGVISDYHFAPTEQSKKNLLKEGKSLENIFVTGNTAIDSLRYTIKKRYKTNYDEWIGKSKLILLTAHRRENLGAALDNIFTALNYIVEKFDDIKILYPIHLNPKIRKLASDKIINNDRLKIIEPMNVVDFHNLMAKSYLVLTDSGGIQEEAPSLNIPVIVLRDTTERPEGLEAGTLVLSGTETEKIISVFCELYTNKSYYNKVANAKNPYGDGFSSKKIVKIIEDKFLEEEVI
jgi:UDP-N-acetylglucosamine 2-epimerase (non-hydrolysing)